MNEGGKVRWEQRACEGVWGEGVGRVWGGGLSGVWGGAGGRSPPLIRVLFTTSTSISCSIYETSFVNNFLTNNEQRIKPFTCYSEGGGSVLNNIYEGQCRGKLLP